MDAEIEDFGDEGVEVQVSYNGELIFRRRYINRAVAEAEAAEKRADLERSGWTAHW